MSQVIKCTSWSIKYHSMIIFIIKSHIFENLLGSEVIGFRGWGRNQLKLLHIVSKGMIYTFNATNEEDPVAC